MFRSHGRIMGVGEIMPSALLGPRQLDGWPSGQEEVETGWNLTLRSSDSQLGQEANLGKRSSEHMTLPLEAPAHLSGFPLPFSMFLQQGDSPLATQT